MHAVTTIETSYLNTSTYVHNSTQNSILNQVHASLQVGACLCVCVCVRVCVCARTRVCVCGGVYVCVCGWVYVCLSVCQLPGPLITNGMIWCEKTVCDWLNKSYSFSVALYDTCC